MLTRIALSTCVILATGCATKTSPQSAQPEQESSQSPVDTPTDDTTTATVLESASAAEPAIREVEEVSEPVAPVSAPTGTQVNQEPQSQASTPPASPAPDASASSSSRPRRGGIVSVRSVYDGDTFTLSDGSKIRLASVNTPELRPAEPYAVEARNAAELFMKGAQVALDPNPPQDSYGRIISQAYVDGESLSEHLVSLGLAHVFLIPPLNENHDIPALLAAQEQAREANRGIWSTEDYRGDLHITSFHANAAGDDRENINGEYLRLCNITSLDLNVDGYYISDASGGKWMFPSVIIPAGHTLKVHSGRGTNATDPREQLAIYLGNDRPIWNNKKDQATIYDRHGRISDSRDHESVNAGQ